MKKKVYVIMPFVTSPTRNQEQLGSFFHNIIKDPIEKLNVDGSEFEVNRSANEFNITESIIKNIAECDILITDLSGTQANPNVMYELGVRLSLSDKPTILIRENHSSNKNIFDISHLHTFGYDPLDYPTLVDYLKSKVEAFETEQEVYRSPILDALSIGKSYFYRASEIQARRKVDLLYESLFGNLMLVLEKTLNSIFLKNPDERDTLMEKVFGERGFQNQVPNFISAIQEKEDLYLYENSKIRRLKLRNPLLSKYVHEFYLHQILPANIEQKINVCVVEYYRTFHSSDTFDDFDTHAAIAHFSMKTLLLMVLVSHVGVFLSLENRKYRQQELVLINDCCDQYLKTVNEITQFLENYLHEQPIDAKYKI